MTIPIKTTVFVTPLNTKSVIYTRPEMSHFLMKHLKALRVLMVLCESSIDFHGFAAEGIGSFIGLWEFLGTGRGEKGTLSSHFKIANPWYTG